MTGRHSTMDIRYKIGNTFHTLSAEELRAVEQSGRCSWQAYIATPTQWPEPTVPVVPLMQARPGAVEPGVRPAHFGYHKVRKGALRPLEYAFINKFQALPNTHLAAILHRNADTVRYAKRVMDLEPWRTGRLNDREQDDLMREATLWYAERRTAYGYD